MRLSSDGAPGGTAAAASTAAAAPVGSGSLSYKVQDFTARGRAAAAASAVAVSIASDTAPVVSEATSPPIVAASVVAPAPVAADASSSSDMDAVAQSRAQRYTAGDVNAQLARKAVAQSPEAAAAATAAALCDAPLSALDQCVVLALCLDVRNSNPADGLTAEEMRTCVARVSAVALQILGRNVHPASCADTSPACSTRR